MEVSIIFSPYTLDEMQRRSEITLLHASANEKEREQREWILRVWGWLFIEILFYPHMWPKFVIKSIWKLRYELKISDFHFLKLMRRRNIPFFSWKYMHVCQIINQKLIFIMVKSFHYLFLWFMEFSQWKAWEKSNIYIHLHAWENLMKSQHFPSFSLSSLYAVDLFNNIIHPQISFSPSHSLVHTKFLIIIKSKK